ncbi:MAG: amidohydrolase [Syntrophobacteraceae bacterium]
MPIQTVDWVLHGADWLVTCDSEMRCFRDGAVAIDRGLLVSVDRTATVRSRFRGLQEMDLRGRLLMPGLVNAHTHAAMSVFRGLADDLPLDRWLYDVIFPAEAAIVGPNMVYWGTLLSCAEMLRNGITTYCDGYFFEEEAARAALDAGMRAVLGQGILDFPSPDQPDPSKARDRAIRFLDSFPTGDRIRPSLFCHAPYTCGPDTLRWTKALCHERGILFQIHLSETASEVDTILDRTGLRPALYLDSLGLLDCDTLCAHGVWLDEHEIRSLAASNARIAHNPESNMKLASGIAPIHDLRASGVCVGLGTDSCASNNDLDLFTEMDRAAKMSKVFRRDPTAAPAREVLAMATRDGARAIGWGDAIGSLEVGKQADLVALELRQPHLTPLYDPISALVTCARGSDVRHAWVAGMMVLDNREPVSAKMKTIPEQVRGILTMLPVGASGASDP